ncbi:MAG: phosphatase PAP2 family protein [Myxococcota bacterium]|nr:phosphatase PAP2 family protein [Myxococcota bacterium]
MSNERSITPEEIVAETVAAPPSYWKRLHAYDEAILVRVRKWEVPRLTKVMRALTNIGNASSWWVMGLGLMACGGSARRPAILLGTAALVGAGVSQVIKRTALRPRPNPQVLGLAALTENPDRFSFPSGHATAAFAVAVSLTGEGAWLGPASMALATGIGVSRVYLGAHYPLDVAAGAVLGSITGLAIRLILA